MHATEEEKAAEQELVLRAQGGEHDAFYALIKRYQKMVWRQSMRVTRKAELADELAQQVFLKAFSKIKSFRGDAPFGAWMFRIAFNLTRDWQRTERYTNTVDLEEVEIAIEAKGEMDLATREGLEHLRGAIAKLPERQRQVVLLRVYEDYSFKEIAAAMGGSEGTAKVNFHYALKSLRSFMGECL